MEQKKETLLIVDDSKFQRTVLKEMLHEKFQLLEAASGEECLEIMTHNSSVIDMVLLDIVMTGIDGFEVLRRRQQMEAFKNIPVIILTTSTSISFQTEAFELGADEFIVKPVDPEVAFSRINNTLCVRRRLTNALKEQENLKMKNQIDEMTNLFNKTAIEQMISQTLSASSGEKHALMVVDIDNFKAANDVYGHKVGDHIIVVISALLAARFSETDYVGRIGGDEFVVFMRNISSEEDARENVRQLLSSIEQKEKLTIPDNISISVGLAFSDENDTSYTTLFNKGDKALFGAKKAGKGCYYEYGTEQELSGDYCYVLVLSSSRNVKSMLEFAFRSPFHLEEVSTIDDIEKHFADHPSQVAAIYLDLSERTDSTDKFWKSLTNKAWIHSCPIIAICQEGNLKQMKSAIMSDLIDDLLLAPLEAEPLKRRTAVHQQIKK